MPWLSFQRSGATVVDKLHQAVLRDEATDEDSAVFDTMMEALDLYFHVTSCPNHTHEERQQAYYNARQAFIDFNGDEDEDEEVLGDDDKQNAPSTNTLQ